MLHAIRLFIRLILYWRFIRILKIQIEYHYNNQYYYTFNYFTIPTTIKLGKKHFKEETLQANSLSLENIINQDYGEYAVSLFLTEVSLYFPDKFLFL